MPKTEIESLRVLKVRNQDTLDEGFIIRAEKSGKHVYYNGKVFTADYGDYFTDDSSSAHIMSGRKFAEDKKEYLENESFQGSPWEIVDDDMNLN